MKIFIRKINERNEVASTYLLSKLKFSNKILHEKFKVENPSHEAIITLQKELALEKTKSAILYSLGTPTSFSRSGARTLTAQ